ncbi:transketolase [Siccirubricoccus sp. KC 17139]|uniref:Transketolase n=1 Tax=Siccirubricoccus soli TaxID=2899147 RepID=A0ABT1D9G2_9PROT|nr:transketolase [Siccirubricoccus soli]MCO6418565.1 transketolase [Siccirubricoccus soli]MCP2684700.1 transketolase [Siccirubricoccus soli]
MASLDPIPGAANPALAVQAELLARPATEARRMADAIRALAIDAVEKAKSGHPGMPLGMADAATALWTRFLKFDAADPRWPDRDRFVLSAGHGSMLLYALLHLTGQAGMGIEDLKRFRQLHSPAAGHPEYGEHPGIETTTGPLGQGIANAVGMAIAERLLAARFGKSLVDHRTWVIAGDGCLQEGISHEAASLAGHLCLEKLCVLWDDNSVTIDGSTDLSFTDDTLKRFAAYGWAVRRVDGHDAEAVAAALAWASRNRKPTLLACKTIIGFSAPTKAGTAGSHGSPLGPDEAAAAKSALGWNHPPFEVPEGLRAQWEAAGRRSAGTRRSWLKRLAKHPQREEFERAIAGRLPESWHEALAALRAATAEQKPKLATRVASQKALEALVPAVPEMVGGSADLTGSNNTNVKGIPAVTPGNFAGRYIHYGVREHGMAAAMNGMALHGGIIPYSGTFLVFADYMRPAIRLAALMRQRVIHVLTHDSIGLGEDGPTHQPVETLAGLRCIPNLAVFRPGDAMETAECWELAVKRADGPSVLALSRQNLAAFRTDAGENRCARGGYVVAEAEGPRQATLIATGSEVGVALAARTALAAEGIATAVVSLPCWELFAAQDASYREQVLGPALRVGIEAAIGFGWERWLGPEGLFIGMSGFGASAPADDLFRHFGITPEAVASAVKKRLG